MYIFHHMCYIRNLCCRANRDVALPVSQPIQGLDGTLMDQILIPKGTLIAISIASGNRDKSVWGEDALQWKPDRWLSALPNSVGKARIPGVYSNL